MHGLSHVACSNPTSNSSFSLTFDVRAEPSSKCSLGQPISRKPHFTYPPSSSYVQLNPGVLRSRADISKAHTKRREPAPN